MGDAINKLTFSSEPGGYGRGPDQNDDFTLTVMTSSVSWDP